ncbi:Putative signal transduction histidine kinase [Croceitalea dokdonensis DOKDO 023]|uniref:Putative signal transduction histidine kinase n=1 Tax=Croceitalea dokdonensis DOKDO 023 TaxID=1300341 RepID=A0A0P7ADU4_9FLAO|nr:histidine kinase [Croceitalea dokdonensis]KPM31383.1 Putative signal transduction histidine kinase [Croceitalea dokdonensis DOKDO 023]
MIRNFNMLIFLVWSVLLLGQYQNKQEAIDLKGAVRGKENYTPISDVEVSTNRGIYTTTNALGEFRIKVYKGDILFFRSSEFEMVEHRVTSDEDVIVEVENYGAASQRIANLDKQQEMYTRALDSARYYKKLDIEKSTDFVAEAIASMGAKTDKKELAAALAILGEVFLYHKQYDLAISNFQDATKASKTVATTLLLGEAYVMNQQFVDARETLEPLKKLKRLVPYQRIALYELLGDTFNGLGNLKTALEFYREGLKVAEKNQVSPKVIDLNSKIAAAYAAADRDIEAQGYFDNSLQLSKKQNPQRAILESEKVADFYNQSNRFDDEIKLRKQTLKELSQLPGEPKVKKRAAPDLDSITSQRINYKIANAYISQDRLNEAIPFLERSIVEADKEDDLVVQKDATRKLSEVYRYQGNIEKAFENYQKYGAIVDTLYIKKEQEISRLARLNRQITSNQNRISSLEQERELSQSKYSLALTEQQLFEESNKRQKWLIYSLMFGMLLFALAAFLYYRTNQQQKLANNLLALKSLRSQMNPHFIFNALNSVNNYIAKSDERSANRFLSEFSLLMRTVLENSEEDFIPLSKELELLQLYVKLEHSRFPEKFDYEVKIDENVAINAFEIPPMLLQPYIENAIWHGLRYKETKGFLNIVVSAITEKMLNIEVIDNGIGRKKSAELKTQNQKKQRSKGMGNIKKRIAILNDMYKNKVEVSINDYKEDGTGTRVVLKLKRD